MEVFSLLCSLVSPGHRRLRLTDLHLISCLSWQVMLKDMEHSKKTLEEELQKTSEVSVETYCMYSVWK